MATIYLVDSNKSSITVKTAVNQATAMAIARGMLYIRFEGKYHINTLKEYWADGLHWFHFQDKQVYCVVKQR